MLGFTVLPPPPRYPGMGPYGSNLSGVVPIVETNNTLENPSGPEWQFLVGEGTYILKEDLHLATPPPHPSEAPIINPNPLSTDPQPASAGTKVTLMSLEPRSPPAAFAKGPTASAFAPDASAGAGDGSYDGRSSGDAIKSSEDSHNGTISDITRPSESAPAFGEGNTLLAAAPLKDATKRRKPKNNVTKSNSSFISRVIINDNLSRRMAERPADGLYGFANINRAFQWLDMSSPTKNDYFTKILFTKAHCLCHDVNLVTKATTHMDVILGFSTGEIIWLEPISQRYTRLNKNGVINNTPVAEIKWIPGSENLFLAAHMDGLLVVYDKEKEDAVFLPEEDEGQPSTNDTPDDGSDPATKIQVQKSVHSKNQKSNPVAAWKLSNQRINAFAFSPDNRHLATVSEDGTLRIIDYLKEELVDLFYSYYGGLTCVCWTPDGKYILTGGQDDLISIWSKDDSALVARCQGHDSWVSSVAVDPWRCDDRNYRFGSVGDDGRLCLWDFNVAMAHASKNATRNRGSISSHPETDHGDGTTNGRNISHEVEMRANIPMIPAVLTTPIHKSPLCWLEFTSDSIMTSCKSGHIRTWNRPGMGPTEPVSEAAQ
ncbi:hypothetical protein VHEMI06795 [[Torrubiella] hemipterigena]|uniref:Uncharacterized protein n=1 Tax=[Torrubiella] hemipterigena TaxID=1531966 RepID=A0A0A1TLR5_9HYPO|nr:hypothetical protein VHEMI06795 [[Torrubiella] hemipterigena]